MFGLGDLEIDRSTSAGIDVAIGTPAQARIGRPLTPLSYAGVARRTARRTIRRQTALPAGCIYGPYRGGYYYNCGGDYYIKNGGLYVQVFVDWPGRKEESE
nr:hypothetical protein [Aurantimonas endophytica]